jgi:hypothetical protein
MSFLVVGIVGGMAVLDNSLKYFFFLKRISFGL